VHPRTQATFAELEQAEWFAAVGVEDTSAATVLFVMAGGGCALRFETWQDTILRQGISNCERLVERSQARFNQWNEIVVPLKALTMPLVVRKTADVCSRHQLPKIFVDTVQWDILHVCMRPSMPMSIAGILCRQAYWYVKGHFPAAGRVISERKLIDTERMTAIAWLSGTHTRCPVCDAGIDCTQQVLAAVRAATSPSRNQRATRRARGIRVSLDDVRRAACHR
jgi:hypothetical protein